MRYVGTSPHRRDISNGDPMTVRLPVAIAAIIVTALGLVAIALSGGGEAIIGPSLAAIIATIFILAGR